MELAGFKRINNVVLKSLDINDLRIIKELSFIGKIYFRFKQSNANSICIHLPFFSKQNIKYFEKYIKYFDHAINMQNQSEPIGLDECFLINFFDDKNEIFKFNETFDNVSKWGDANNYCYTTVDAFTPVFYSNGENELSYIKNNLPLYQAMREVDVVKDVVKINLDVKNIYVQEYDKSLECFKNGLFSDFRLESTGDTDYLNEIYEEIHGQNVMLQISVKYPYFSNINSHFIRDDINNLQVTFNNRFTIRDAKAISSNDLIVLPNELFEWEKPLIDANPYFEIVQTNAGGRIRELLTDVLEGWKNLDVNKYQYPFPKYFFLLICKEEPISFWISNFKKSYPFIFDKPIYHLLSELFNLIYELDWSRTLSKVDEKINFIFPDLDNNSTKSRILREPFGVFKQYHSKLKAYTSFSSEIKEDKMNYVLNNFDINYLINNALVDRKKIVKVVIPDFLYYNINPFGLYQLYNYQFLSYFTDIRQRIFPEITPYRADCESYKSKLLSKSREDLKKYVKSISVEEKSNVNVDKFDVITFDEILDEVEETEKVKILRRNINENSIKVTGNLNGEIVSFDSESLVYILRNNFLKIKAVEILENDLYLNIKKIKVSMKNAFLIQLEAIPESVKYFNYNLYRKGDAFKKLKRIGLKITGEDYFNKTYISNVREFDIENFKLPRKQDRGLICEFLNIASSEMQIAYVAKYKNNVELKRLYSEIIDLIIDEGYIDIVRSDIVTNRIVKILDDSSLDISEEYNLEEFANNIVDGILDKLTDFLEPITNLKHEIKSYK
ncbi:hypothetical protein FAZ19_11935 [Sphingobacterium alkalisoli]|uniref:Uncharacterized protein n=1 Tax=Sphingobacterium alkalisoli TaxID=1874115 RepID=A0A4U0H657_9SPHI|nr:hypothetical protein [Sphingobacterium alkalisoli]TJY65822.1 hypothetical protein FAZ19_11935 [Sphingobacterium alkalisoli]GGH18106.1 hypothetical protein GCM10011418_21530 [Sphingobacterium alkalisoli]